MRFSAFNQPLFHIDPILQALAFGRFDDSGQPRFVVVLKTVSRLADNSRPISGADDHALGPVSIVFDRVDLDNFGRFGRSGWGRWRSNYLRLDLLRPV